MHLYAAGEVTPASDAHWMGLDTVRVIMQVECSNVRTSTSYSRARAGRTHRAVALPTTTALPAVHRALVRIGLILLARHRVEYVSTGVMQRSSEHAPRGREETYKH